MHFSPRRPYTHELLISLKTECATRLKDNREQKNSTKNKTEESMYDYLSSNKPSDFRVISAWFVHLPYLLLGDNCEVFTSLLPNEYGTEPAWTYL
jgi:hypothetical protein